MLTATPFETLSTRMSGRVVTPSDADWDATRQVFNLAMDLSPAAVALPLDVSDVVAAVDYARVNGLRVAPQATGHNADAYGSLEDTLLVDVRELQEVRVDVRARRVRARAAIAVIQSTGYHGGQRPGACQSTGAMTAANAASVGAIQGGSPREPPSAMRPALAPARRVDAAARKSATSQASQSDVEDRLAGIGDRLRRAGASERRVEQQVTNLSRQPAVGTPEQITEMLLGMEKRGLGYAITYFADAAYDRSGIELFEREVVPALRD